MTLLRLVRVVNSHALKVVKQDMQETSAELQGIEVDIPRHKGMKEEKQGIAGKIVEEDGGVRVEDTIKEGEVLHNMEGGSISGSSTIIIAKQLDQLMKLLANPTKTPGFDSEKKQVTTM